MAGVWVSDDLQPDLTSMVDKADGSVVPVQLQVAFLWECDNYGLSPSGWLFACLLLLLGLILPVCYPRRLFPIFSALTAASTFSRRIG